jgi:type I restriction enzyme R subunit
LEGNFDKKDPKFISLFEELKRLFKKKNIEELDSAEMDDSDKRFEKHLRTANALNNKDAQLASQV